LDVDLRNGMRLRGKNSEEVKGLGVTREDIAVGGVDRSRIR
jgi:hypothetical protein